MASATPRTGESAFSKGFRVLRAVVAVVLVLAGLFALLFFDVAGVTRIGLAWAFSAVLDREVSIDRLADFSLTDTFDVAISGLRVEENEPGDEDLILAIDTLHVSVSLAALVAGDVYVPRVGVSGLTLTLRRTARDGQWHGLDFMDGDEEIVLPIIGRFSLEKSVLRISDEASGESLSVVVDKLALDGDDGTELSHVNASGLIQNRPFQISGSTLQPKAILARRAPVPVNLELVSELVDATVAGTIDPFESDARADLTFDAAVYGFRDFVDPLFPFLGLDGVATISGRFSGTMSTPAIHELDLNAIFAKGGDLRVLGSIEDIRDLRGVDLSVALETVPPPHWFERIPDLPLSPALATAEGRITEDTGTLHFENWRFTYEDRQKIESDLRASGAATLQGGHVGGLQGKGELKITVQDPRRILTGPIGTSLDTGPLGIATSLKLGQSGDLSVSSGSVTASGPLEFSAAFSGDIGRLSIDPADFELDLDTIVQGMTQNAAVWASVFGMDTPYLTDMSYRARISGSSEYFSVEDIDATAGTLLSADVQVTGRIGEISFPMTPARVQGIALNLKGQSSNLAAGAGYWGLDIPDIGAASASLDVVGDLELLKLENLQVRGGRDGVVGFTATGSLGRIDVGGASSVAKGLDIAVEAIVPTAKGFAELSGRPPPLVETATLTATISGNSDAPNIRALEIVGTGKGGLEITSRGEIDDAATLSGVSISFSASLNPVSAVNAIASGHSDLGPVTLSGNLVDYDGTLGLENLQVSNGHREKWSLNAAGEIDDLFALDEIAFDTQLSVDDPAFFANALGIDPVDLKPMNFHGTVAGRDEAINLRGTLTVGQSTFAGHLNGSLDGPVPNFSGTIHSDLVDLTDFVMNDEEHDQKAKAAQTSAKSESAPVFSTAPIPLDILKRLNLALDLSIDELRGDKLRIDRLTSKIELANGVLDLNPMLFEFVNGQLQGWVTVSVHDEVPRYGLSFHADDFDLESAFSVLNANAPLDGQMHLAADLSARGHSPAEIARSLAGDMDVAVENGYVQTGFFDLLGNDLFSWLLSPGSFRGKTEIGCFVLRLDSRDGKVDLTNFVLDTPGTRVGGTGQILLDDERLDLVFAPKPKKRLVERLSTPIKVTGALINPDVRFNVLGVTVDTVGKIVFSPITAIQGFLSGIASLGEEERRGCAS